MTSHFIIEASLSYKPPASLRQLKLTMIIMKKREKLSWKQTTFRGCESNWSVTYCHVQTIPKLNDLKQPSVTAYECMGQRDISPDPGLARLILPGFIHGLQTVDQSLGSCPPASLSWYGSSLLCVSLILQQNETCSHCCYRRPRESAEVWKAS